MADDLLVRAERWLKPQEHSSCWDLYSEAIVRDLVQEVRHWRDEHQHCVKQETHAFAVREAEKYAQEVRDLRANEKSAEVRIAELCDAHEEVFIRAEAQTAARQRLAVKIQIGLVRSAASADNEDYSAVTLTIMEAREVLDALAALSEGEAPLIERCPRCGDDMAEESACHTCLSKGLDAPNLEKI